MKTKTKTKRYRTISEISDLLNINQHVIRYWDAKFDGISIRLKDNKQRLFNDVNINKIREIKSILYDGGKNNYPLSMAKKLLKKDNNKINNLKDLHEKTINIDELRIVSLNLKKILENT